MAASRTTRCGWTATRPPSLRGWSRAWRRRSCCARWASSWTTTRSTRSLTTSTPTETVGTPA
eukprot:7369021-Prymnesium_polylepis.1